jgi:hypothetical protein
MLIRLIENNQININNDSNNSFNTLLSKISSDISSVNYVPSFNESDNEEKEDDDEKSISKRLGTIPADNPTTSSTYFNNKNYESLFLQHSELQREYKDHLFSCSETLSACSSEKNNFGFLLCFFNFLLFLEKQLQASLLENSHLKNDMVISKQNSERFLLIY